MNEFETQVRVLELEANALTSYAAILREKGLHVGLGSDPYCLNCGERWPCSSEMTS